MTLIKPQPKLYNREDLNNLFAVSNLRQSNVLSHQKAVEYAVEKVNILGYKFLEIKKK